MSKTYLISLIGLLMSTTLLSQGSLEHRQVFYFGQNKKFSGSFNIKLIVSIDQQTTSKQFGLTTPIVLPSPSQKKNVQIALEFDNLTFDNNRFRDAHLIFKANAFRTGPNIRLVSSTKKLTPNGNPQKVIFDIVGEKADKIQFDFEVIDFEKTSFSTFEKNGKKQFRKLVLTQMVHFFQNEPSTNNTLTTDKDDVVESADEVELFPEAPTAAIIDEPIKENTALSGMSEAEFYKNVINSNDLTKLKQYIRKFPKGPNKKHFRNVNNKLDTLQWENSKRINKANAYINYLAVCPNGGFRAEAKEQIVDLAWQRTKKRNTLKAHESYLKYLKKSHKSGSGKTYKLPQKHIAEANDFLRDIEFKLNRKESTFNYQFQYANLPLKITQTSDSNLVYKIKKNEITFRPTQRGITSVIITDVTGKTATLQMDQSILPLNGDMQESENSIRFINISGGKPPYLIVFKQDHITYPPFEFNADQFSIDKSQLQERGMVGNFNVFLKDQQYEHFTFSKNINVLPPSNWWRYFALGALALASVFFALIYAIRNRASKKKMKAFKERTTQMPAMVKEPQAPQAKIVKNTNQSIFKKTSPRTGTKNKVVLQKISGKDKYKGLGISVDRVGFESEEFYTFEMDKIWSDSIVAKVLMHRSCILELDNFLQKHDKEKMKENEDVPEIGGFLLGRFQQNEDADYIVAIDVFVPITPEFQNAYKVDFGTKAWRELDDIKDWHPDLEIIGWFHTHPGHGLFLSKPDLKIQNNVFKLPYQIAMEIDPLTTKIDTAFFTYKKNGIINNRDTPRQIIDWFKWTDANQWTRG